MIVLGGMVGMVFFLLLFKNRIGVNVWWVIGIGFFVVLGLMFIVGGLVLMLLVYVFIGGMFYCIM